MRATLTLPLLATACSLSAQLQNGGFEALSSLDMPAYWTTGIELIVIGDSVVVDSAKYLLNSTDVHSGLHAAELRNSYNYTQDLGSPGRWFATPLEEGYGGFPAFDVPVVLRPQAMTFWAKYAPVSGDIGYAVVRVFNASQDEIGSGELHIEGNVSTYTAFEVPIAYSSADSAAYVNILFITMVPGGNPHLGTRMLIDDVEIDYVATGITEEDARALRFFPNPAIDEVRMTGLNAGQSATARVLDATGRVVISRPLIDGHLSLDGSAPGAYLVRVDQGGILYQGRLVITH
ncbi:MAG: T9SS type A sorting domain-containing protein [Flavobacteriales bacterium]